MTTYLFVTDIDSYDPQGVQTGTDYWWSCSKTAVPGDLALVYLVGGVGIEYEWQITSQAERNDEWGYVCDVRHLRTFKPPISLREICSLVSKAEWALPHLNFRGYRSIRIPDQVAARLRSLRPASQPRTTSNRGSVRSSNEAKRQIRSSLRCVWLVQDGQPSEREAVMRRSTDEAIEQMRSEYDFDYSTAIRGKYYRRLLKEGANVVVLEPDVAKAFRSSAAVNDALRSLIKTSRPKRRLTTRSSGRAKSGRR